MWQWILGFVCGLPCLGFVAFMIFALIMSQRDKAKAIRDGVHTIAWLVQANYKLFELDSGSYPAQFLIMLDPSVSDPRPILEPLAARVAHLKTADPQNAAEEEAAATVRDEAYDAYRKAKLPISFTGGPEVFSVHIWVERSLLPEGRLTRRYVHAAYIPDAHGQVYMLPYPENER